MDVKKTRTALINKEDITIYVIPHNDKYKCLSTVDDIGFGSGIIHQKETLPYDFFRILSGETDKHLKTIKNILQSNGKFHFKTDKHEYFITSQKYPDVLHIIRIEVIDTD
jgi:hypothetical protein